MALITYFFTKIKNLFGRKCSLAGIKIMIESLRACVSHVIHRFTKCVHQIEVFFCCALQFSRYDALR